MMTRYIPPADVIRLAERQSDFAVGTEQLALVTELGRTVTYTLLNSIVSVEGKPHAPKRFRHPLPENTMVHPLILITPNVPAHSLSTRLYRFKGKSLPEGATWSDPGRLANQLRSNLVKKLPGETGGQRPRIDAVDAEARGILYDYLQDRPPQRVTEELVARHVANLGQEVCDVAVRVWNLSAEPIIRFDEEYFTT